jgi:hypothetical protein
MQAFHRSFCTYGACVPCEINLESLQRKMERIAGEIVG